MGTLSKKNGDFGRNLHIFPCAFNAHAEGIPLEFCNGYGVEKICCDAPNRWLKFDDSMVWYTRV